MSTADTTYRLLFHKDLSHMSIDLFSIDSKPQQICYQVRSSEIEFVGSRKFELTEVMLDSVTATIKQAEEELFALIEGQKLSHVRAGGRIQ